MKALALLLTALALALAGCGGDDDGNDEPSGSTTSQPSAQSAPAEETEPPAQSSGEDREAVQEVVKRWMLEGDCDLMTDKFLEEQLLGLGDNRKERCDLFEKQHQKPQYGEDDIKITDVQVTGTKATLVVGSDNAPDITSKYSLVKTGDQWQIDVAELQ